MGSSWKTVRVFISSTFRDMQAERDHLVRFVFPRLRDELLKHRIHLIDVDLRWGVTSDQDAVSVCREVIDECHPRFIGMLGGRYGWIPPGHEQSITADEIHYAVLAREAISRHNAFFYFRDEAASARIIEREPGEFRDPPDGPAAQKLAALKQAIAEAGLPTFTYDAIWAAAQGRLTGLESFGNHIYATLLDSIQLDPDLADVFSESADSAGDEFAGERAAMEAFIEDRTQRYVVGSRKAVLDGMIAFAHADTEQNVLVVEGKPGSGKSSLLGKFYQTLAAQEPGLLIPHFVGASVGSTDLRRTLQRLCQELSAAACHPDPLPEEIRELTDLFCKLLVETAKQTRVILVLDAINQFDAAHNAHAMRWLPEQLPPNVRVIVSSLAHGALDAIRRRGDPVRFEKVELLSGADAFEIIDAFLQRYSKRLSSEQTDALLAKSDSRLPLYLTTVLQELRTLGTYEEITARIKQFPTEVKALFGWILKVRLSNDPGFLNVEGQPCGAALVAKLALYLSVSRRGLSQQELVGLLDPGDPLGNVAALIRLLRPYLMLRGELLDFFHDQFRQATEASFVAGESDRRAQHLALADYFERQVNMSPRKATEWPYQLKQAKSWRRLEACLTDIPLFLALFNDDDQWDLTGYWLPLQEQGRQMGDCYLEAWKNWLDASRQSEDFYVCGQLGTFLSQNSCNRVAKSLLEHSLHAGTRMRGAEHADTLVILQNLASLHADEGNYTEAEKLYRQALAFSESSMGAEHPDTLMVKTNLGRVLTNLRQYEEAEQLLRQALTVRERTLGREHIDTLYSLQNLAYLLFEMGDYSECELLARRLMKARERVLGDNHPSTLSSINDYANLLNRTGNNLPAESLYRRVLEARERVLGPDHRDTFSSISNLANLLEKMSDGEGAETLERRAMEGRVRVLGANDVDTLRSKQSLGSLLFRRGDLAGAEPLFRDALAGREQIFGPEHFETLTTMRGLAAVLGAKGNLVEAEPLFRRSLEISCNLLGENHPLSQECLENLVVLLKAKGDHAGAAQLRLCALEIKERRR